MSIVYKRLIVRYIVSCYKTRTIDFSIDKYSSKKNRNKTEFIKIYCFKNAYLRKLYKVIKSLFKKKEL